MNLAKREIIGLFVVVILAILGIATCNHINKLKNDYANVAKINAGLENKVKTYTDENGNLHTNIEKIQADAKAYRDSHEKDLDSVANLLGVKAKNITELTHLVTQYKGKLSAKIDTAYIFDTTYLDGVARIDTLKVLDFPYKDRYMTFHGRIIKDSVHADYTITDSLSLTTYQRRTGFLHLGKTKTYLDISGQNPNFSILKASNVELTKIKDKKWSLGPYIGYGYDGTTWKPSVGISIQRTLIRF